MYDEEYNEKNDLSYHNTTDNLGDGFYNSNSNHDTYSNTYHDPYSSTYTNYSTTGTTPDSGKNKKKKGGFAKKVAVATSLALVFGVVSGAGFYTTNYVMNKVNPTQTKTIATSTAATTANSANLVNDLANSSSSTGTTTAYDVSSVVSNVMPSIVSITNMSTQSVNNIFGQSGTYDSESSGSGIIVGQNDSELLIVTNNHVVEGANTLSIQFIDSSTVEAQIKGTDADMDLAVVAVPLDKMSQDTLNQIKVATLGDSSSLKVGEPAIAIGNALGYGQSVTTGVISALNRTITVNNVTNSLIQTDAAINPGNSGGALLNTNGELIGINAVKYASSEVEGMGYAIPISAAKPIIDELMNKETRSKVDSNESSYLGISGVDVTSDVSQTYGIPTGVYVAQVIEGSAAEKAGIKKGDIITAFDGQGVTSMSDLQNLMQYYAAGTKVEVTLQTASNNGYSETKVNVELGKKVQEAQ